MKRNTLLIAAALASASLSGYPSFDAASFSVASQNVAAGAEPSKENASDIHTREGLDCWIIDADSFDIHSREGLERKVAELENAKDYEGLVALDDNETAAPSFASSRQRITLVPGYKARFAIALSSGDPAQFDAVVVRLIHESRRDPMARHGVSQIIDELRRTNPEAAADALERIGLAVIGRNPDRFLSADEAFLPLSSAVRYEILIDRALDAQDAETLKALVQQTSTERSTPSYNSQIAAVLNKLTSTTTNTSLKKEIEELVRRAQSGDFLNKEVRALPSKLDSALKSKNQEEVQKLVLQMRAQFHEIRTTGDVFNVITFVKALQNSDPNNAERLDLLVDLGKEFAILETPNKYLLLDAVAKELTLQLDAYVRRCSSHGDYAPEGWQEKTEAILDHTQENVCFAIRVSHTTQTLNLVHPRAAAKALRAERDALAGLSALDASELADYDASIDAVEASIVKEQTFEGYIEAFARLAAAPENASAAILLKRKHALEDARERLVSSVSLPKYSPRNAEEAEKWRNDRKTAFDAYNKAQDSLCVRIVLNAESDPGERSQAAYQLASIYRSQNNLDAITRLVAQAQSANADETILEILDTSLYAIRLEQAYHEDASAGLLTAIIDEGVEKSQKNRIIEQTLIDISGCQTGEKNEALALEILDRLIAAAEKQVAEEEKRSEETKKREEETKKREEEERKVILSMGANRMEPMATNHSVSEEGSAEERNRANEPGLNNNPQPHPLPSTLETAAVTHLGALKGTRDMRLVNKAITAPNHEGLDAAVAEFAADAQTYSVAAELALRLYQQLWTLPKEENLRQYALQLGDAAIHTLQPSGMNSSPHGMDLQALEQATTLQLRKIIAAHDSGDAAFVERSLDELNAALTIPEQLSIAANELASELPQTAAGFVKRYLDATRAEAKQDGAAHSGSNIANRQRVAANLCEKVYNSVFAAAVDDKEAFHAAAEEYIGLMRENPEMTLSSHNIFLNFGFEYPDVVLKIYEARGDIVASFAAKEAAPTLSPEPVDPLKSALKILIAARQNTPEALDDAAAQYAAQSLETRSVTNVNLHRIIDEYIHKDSAVTPTTNGGDSRVQKSLSNELKAAEILGAAVKTLEASPTPEAQELIRELK